MKKRKSTILKVFIVIIIIIIAYIGITIGGTYKYLKEYGYGINELPQTLAVYFHLSKGFTVEEKEGGDSIFIGRENWENYDNVVEKRGYKEIERYGTAGLYKKGNSKNEEYDFSITATEDWCHWFRIYIIDNDYKIEDFN